MTRRRAVLAAAAAAALAGAGWWLAGRVTSHALPDEVVVADTVAELSRTLDPAAVVAQDAKDPVRAGVVRPGNRLAGEGEREGLIAPPASRLRFALDVPPDGVLELAVGVQGDGTRDRTRSGVRFAVLLDGRERWSRTVNPAGAKRDRRWHPARIDLGPAAGRRATVELVTTADRPGQPLAGVPAWSGVRLVRETRRPRQAAAPDAPNVLVLLVDTLRADRVGVYGARPSPTPTLDALAASGLRLRPGRLAVVVDAAVGVLALHGTPPAQPRRHRRRGRRRRRRLGLSDRRRRHLGGGRDARRHQRRSACPPTRSCRAARTWRRASRPSSSCLGSRGETLGERARW